MQTATADRLAPGDLGDDHDHGDDGVDQALLAGLVQDAAAGSTTATGWRSSSTSPRASTATTSQMPWA